MLLAEKEGKASQAEDLLFEAIYEKGLNISDISTLEHIGEELQLPEVLPLLFFYSCSSDHVMLSWRMQPDASCCICHGSQIYTGAFSAYRSRTTSCDTSTWHVPGMRCMMGSCIHLMPYAGQELPPVQ